MKQIVLAILMSMTLSQTAFAKVLICEDSSSKIGLSSESSVLHEAVTSVSDADLFTKAHENPYGVVSFYGTTEDFYVDYSIDDFTVSYDIQKDENNNDHLTWRNQDNGSEGEMNCRSL